MSLNNFYDNSNTPLNAVQVMISEVLMFHENKELYPSGDYYDLSVGNAGPDERIVLSLVVIPVRYQLQWVEIAKKY